MGTWTTKFRSIAAATAAAALLAAPPAEAGTQAKDSTSPSAEENVGAVSGLAVGALAGGPFGAVVGAAIGGWVGERLHREASGRKAATEELAVVSASLTQANAHGAELATLLDRVHELETDIGFRTEEASVSPEAASKLYRLGTLLASMPDTQVRISGHADVRGTEQYNLALSERRAAAVSAELARAGVPHDRLLVEALGEGASSGEDVDTQALERRVTVRIERGAIAVAHGGAIR